MYKGASSEDISLTLKNHWMLNGSGTDFINCTAPANIFTPVFDCIPQVP